MDIMSLESVDNDGHMNAHMETAATPKHKDLEKVVQFPGFEKASENRALGPDRSVTRINSQTTE